MSGYVEPAITLWGVIAEQPAVIERLGQRSAAFEARLSGHGTGGPPGKQPVEVK